MKELDDKVARAHVDLQTDVDLAVQPVRTENAQLRRYAPVAFVALCSHEGKISNLVFSAINVFFLSFIKCLKYNLS